MHTYLSLKVKGHHGETEVEQEVLLLQTLQGPAYTERHHVWPLDEQRGAEDVDRAQTHDAHEAHLQQTHITVGDSVFQSVILQAPQVYSVICAIGTLDVTQKP